MQMSEDNLEASLPPSHYGFPPMEITDEEFRAIRNLVYQKFGINLTEEKRALVIGRLGKFIRQLGFDSFREYYKYLISDKTGQALDPLVNRISTNFTFFFREKDHFEFFQNTVLKEMAKRIQRDGHRDLRVWCAGCSTGEEPYTLAMLMMEFFGTAYSQWEAGLLATDISARALQKAMVGTYPEEALKQLPGHLKTRYFNKSHTGEYSVSEYLRNEVTFRRFNLMNQRFPFKKPFHVIFCRNVMIYFDPLTREALTHRLYQSMVPGGYLFIGHSETLGRKQSLFQYIRPAVYRRN